MASDCDNIPRTSSELLEKLNYDDNKRRQDRSTRDKQRGKARTNELAYYQRQQRNLKEQLNALSRIYQDNSKDLLRLHEGSNRVNAPSRRKFETPIPYLDHSRVSRHTDHTLLDRTKTSDGRSFEEASEKDIQASEESHATTEEDISERDHNEETTIPLQEDVVQDSDGKETERLKQENEDLRSTIEELQQQLLHKRQQLAELEAKLKKFEEQAKEEETEIKDKNLKAIAEKHTELYEREWSGAFEELADTDIDDLFIIEFLLQIFKETHALNVSQEGSKEDIKRTIKKIISIKLETTPGSPFNFDQYPQIMGYADACISHCVSVMELQPAPYVDFDAGKGDEFMEKHYRQYTKVGKVLDYVVWPALFSHKDGQILAKGVAQPR